MNVSVVIPNYNGEKYIRGCLDSLMKQSMKIDEIIIVDNSSTDRSLEIIKEYKDYITLVELEDNYGFSRAVNEGIKRAKTKYVALLNNDTEVDKDWLVELYKCIDSNSDIFACCSQMIRYDNRDIIDDAGDEYTLLGWGRKIGDGENIHSYNFCKEVFSACAGAAIYRRDVFRKIGYFDERFFAYLEDIDICYRAKVYGYINYYCGKSKVYHIGSATSGSKHNKFKVKLSARNNIYLITKNMATWQIAINFIFIILGIIIKGTYFTTKGLGGAYFSGVFEGLRSRHMLDRVRIKNNYKVYKKIECELFKNTLNLLKRG